LSIFGILFATAMCGCGAPGEPTPPSPPVLVAITDLRARQAGESVQLSLTLPSKTITGERLSDPPAVEILRGALQPNGSPDAKSFRVVQTIPGALLENYRVDDRVQLSDTLPLEEIRSHPGGVLAYRVRTRASPRRASADSNTVTIHLVPVAERITSLRATPTESAIELTWEGPTRTADGEPLGVISEYRVYRGEIEPSTEALSKDLSQVKWKSPLALGGHSTATEYRDTNFDFGKTYVYTVRTVTLAEDNPVESSDSLPVVITPQDVYPPGVPLGLVAVVIVAEATREPEVDLSWSINPETDLGGYRVYRSEQQETRGQPITPDLLLSPAYRDTSVHADHRYWYVVTAVDRAGNESAASAPVAVDVTQPSP
jgi:hypothetical protein